MNEFERNLALVLAHSALYEAKLTYSPDGVVDDAVGEDDVAPSTSDSADATMRAWHAYMPGLIRKLGKEMPALEQKRLEAAQLTSPGYSALQTQIYGENAPELARISQAVDASNRLAGANADLSVLAGPGVELLDQATGLMRRADPEFFAVREKAGANLLDLLGQGLTPGEEEAVSRRVARDNIASGTAGVPSATQSVANAMQFGDAARNRTLQGLQSATSFLPQSRSGIDPVQTALGRPSINTGDSKFMGVQQESGQTSDIGNNFLNQLAGFQNTGMEINAQKRDWMDRVNEGIGSINF